MNASRRLALVSAIALVLSAPAHGAPVPNAVPYYLYVTRGGVGFTGAVDVEMQFFDAATGGNSSAGPIIIQNIPVTNGIGEFLADFGAINPFGNEDTYYGGGIRDGASEGAFQPFSGRGRFLPRAYALHAQKIAPGIVGSAEIVPAQVQRRLANGCNFAEAIRVVNQDGSVECEPVSGSGSGGSITSINPGAGLAGGGSTGAVTLGVAPLGIGASLLGDGAVTTAKLAAASVDASKLAGNSVGTAALIDASVTNAKLAAASVDASRLADASVGTLKLVDASVTAAKLVDDSVGVAAIDEAAVQRRVAGTCAVGAAVRQINADGSVLCDAFPGGAADTWQLAGNPITAGQFLGTTNTLPLELRADNRRIARLESLDDPDGSAYGGPIRTAKVALGAAANSASAPGSTVGGGGNAQLPNSASGEYSTVAGGRENSASGDFSFAVGSSNVAVGEHSIALGDNNAAVADNSFAAGHEARVRGPSEVGDSDGDRGSFVWSDSQAGSGTASTGDNQFIVRAGGGLWFGASSPVDIPAGQFIATSTGAHLTSGGTWTNASSRTLKRGFASIDSREVLNALIDLPIQTWSYLGSQEGRHLGPVAEDFKAAFDLGGDGRSIATVDADGVALAAIQGLNAKLEAERDALREELAALRRQVEALRTGRN